MPKPRRNSAAWGWGAAGASLLAAMLINILTGGRDHWADLLIGWGAATFVVAIGNTLMRRTLTAEPERAASLAIGFIVGRLFILLILIGIVLFGTFLRAGPFLTGLFCAYFVGVWVEIGWLTARSGAGGTDQQTGF